MSAHKRKRCWYCTQEGIRKTFKNRTQMRDHIRDHHGIDDAYVKTRTTFLFNRDGEHQGVPNVVHFGKRARKKLGLEYNRAGHLRSTLEPVEREAT